MPVTLVLCLMMVLRILSFSVTCGSKVVFGREMEEAKQIYTERFEPETVTSK